MMITTVITMVMGSKMVIGTVGDCRRDGDGDGE